MKLLPNVNIKLCGMLVLMITTSAACTEAKQAKPVTEAAPVAAAAEVEEESLAQTLGSKLNLHIDAIADSPVDGLLQLNTDKGLFYASKDGDYFLQARIYNVTDGIVDETENALKDMRLSGMQKFSDSAIVFKAENEKYVVDVFTDATCGYCRKLHREIAQYNELGITIRYLAFPRSGLTGENYDNTVSIWCAEDPNKAMNLAKAGAQITAASCDNKVAEQYRFGQSVGVNGTPNIVLPDGSVVPGYQPAQALAAALQSMGS